LGKSFSCETNCSCYCAEWAARSYLWVCECRHEYRWPHNRDLKAVRSSIDAFTQRTSPREAGPLDS